MVLNGAMELTTREELRTAGSKVTGTYEELTLMPVNGLDTEYDQDANQLPAFILSDEDDLDDEDDFEDEEDYEDEEDDFEDDDELEDDDDGDEEDEYDGDEEDDYEEEDDDWDNDYE